MSLVTFLGVDLFRKREGVDLFFIYNDSGAQMSTYCDECTIYNHYFNETNKLSNHHKMSRDKERKITAKIKKKYIKFTY